MIKLFEGVIFMSISSRFAVGIHILSVIEMNKDGVSSSEFIADSVNTNPAVIRKIMGMLKKAGLVEVHPGIAGAKLARDLSKISLLDVYKAVNVVQEKELFSVHENPNPACPVGRNIQDTIIPLLSTAQLALEKVLEHVTIGDVIEEIVKKENLIREEKGN
jgi:DNA-binding IscR family transcriptional regulator